MSVATVVTMGYGSFGSVNLLPTIGYSISGPVFPNDSSFTRAGPADSSFTRSGPADSSFTRSGPAGAGVGKQQG